MDIIPRNDNQYDDDVESGKSSVVDIESSTEKSHSDDEEIEEEEELYDIKLTTATDESSSTPSERPSGSGTGKITTTDDTYNPKTTATTAPATTKPFILVVSLVGALGGLIFGYDISGAGVY
jgi:hypothetical protein